MPHSVPSLSLNGKQTIILWGPLSLSVGSLAMATSTYDLPSSSQQSASDLSEPPEFTEEEIAEFTATMPPHTRSQSETNDDLTVSHIQSVDNEPSTKSGVKDNIVAEIEVAPRSSRRRVPSKRAQVTFSQPASSAAPAPKRPKTSAKKWTPEYVTQSNKSPLVNKDLRVGSPYQEPEFTGLLTHKTRPCCCTPKHGMSSAMRTRRRYSPSFRTQNTS